MLRALLLLVVLAVPVSADAAGRPAKAVTIIVVRDNARDAASAAFVQVAGPYARNTLTAAYTRGANTFYVASGAWLKPSQLAAFEVLMGAEIQTSRVKIHRRGPDYTGKTHAKVKALGLVKPKGPNQ